MLFCLCLFLFFKIFFMDLASRICNRFLLLFLCIIIVLSVRIGRCNLVSAYVVFYN